MVLGVSDCMTKAVMWLFLVGCAMDPTPQPTHVPPPPTSSDPAPPSPESTIEQQFDQDVAPLLAAKCTGCHEDFVFASIVASPELSGDGAPADSRLLTKGAHEGPPWTTAEAQTILTWLDALAAQP